MTYVFNTLITSWDILNNSANIFSVITFIVSVFIWIKVWQQENKLKKLIKGMGPIIDYSSFYNEFQEVKTNHPAALCISLLDNTNSIKKTVSDFLQVNNLAIDHIIEIKMDGIHNQSDIETYINELRKIRRGALAEASEVCLFIAGPVQAGTIAGAVLDNWVPVLLYHKGRAGYKYWGPLLKH
jgi:SMODS-associated and fused to various effectors sensor domain